MTQQFLFTAENLLDFHPLAHHEHLFQGIDFSPLETLLKHRGRLPFSPVSLVKALIYKNLKGLSSLSEITRELSDNPSLCLTCGFDPAKLPPTVERFSHFLRTVPNDLLQQIRIGLVTALIRKKEITGRYLSIDGCNIPVPVKENNPKVPFSRRFDKHHRPAGDPQVRLGIQVLYPNDTGRKIAYFWGYKNICVSDTKSELPVSECTRPANVAEPTVFIPLVQNTQRTFSFPLKGILADAIYDTEDIFDFVIHSLKAKPYIAHNPRAGREVILSPKGNRVCIAGFEMLYWGKFSDRGRIRLKYVCPITHSKKFRAHQPYCPWFHPRFTSGNGCVAYRRVQPHLRETVKYVPGEFKRIYRLRTSAERIFSRLLTVTMQNPSVRGLQAVSNHCTLAHITILGVALAASRSKHRDKIRFVKTFLPELYSQLSKNK